MNSGIKWVCGLLLMYAGIRSLIMESLVVGICFILSALICIPPILNLIEAKMNMRFRSWQKYILVIALIIVAYKFDPYRFNDKGVYENQAADDKNSEEQTKIETKESEKYETASPTTKTYSMLDAFPYAKQFVRQKIKSPSTADFPWTPDEGSHQVNANTFIVMSYVDSENGFGALKRTHYICQITFSGDDNATCDYLTFDE